MKTPISIAAAFILSGAFALAEVVFSTDFESGVPPEFSGVTSTESVQGYSQHGFSGEFLRNLTTSPQGKTTLTLTDLPDHDFVHLGFLLAIIDTWDGPESEAAGGPDWFNVTVDGTLIFSEHFQNAYGGAENYPAAPPGVLLVEQTQLGFRNISPNDTESGFSMGNDPAFQQIPHTGPTVVIEWYANGAGWQGSTDESWAIDNVFVSVSSIGDLPSIELMWVSADTLELSYKGVLQESEDLIEWVDFSPQPISPYRFSPSGSRKFYRARSY